MIVKRLAVPLPKDGEVLVPVSQQKPLTEGIVVAVGPQIHDLEPGMQVHFVDFAGYEIEVDGESYLSMRDEEITGVRPVMPTTYEREHAETITCR